VRIISSSAISLKYTLMGFCWKVLLINPKAMRSLVLFLPTVYSSVCIHKLFHVYGNCKLDLTLNLLTQPRAQERLRHQQACRRWNASEDGLRKLPKQRALSFIAATISIPSSTYALLRHGTLFSLCTDVCSFQASYFCCNVLSQ
jgi:hypothetical protein